MFRLPLLRSFHDAAQEGDVQRLESRLRKGVDVDRRLVREELQPALSQLALTVLDMDRPEKLISEAGSSKFGFRYGLGPQAAKRCEPCCGKGAPSLRAKLWLTVCSLHKRQPLSALIVALTASCAIAC